jgi:outer membrane lipoprotein-sorting protein
MEYPTGGIFRMTIQRCLTAALFAAAMSLTLAAGSARAETAVPAKLSAADRAAVTKVEKYLDGITTMSARFVQTASNGSVARGRFYLSRPGKMRFEYDPPTPVLLIATGTLLVYYDKELDQVSQVLLSSTPISVLVEKDVKFAGDVTVTGIARHPGTLRIRLTETENPDEGSITLVFTEAPLALRQWTVVDSQGIETTVTLSGVRFGQHLDPSLFHFNIPGRDPTR